MSKFRRYIDLLIERFRIRLARQDALLHLAFLGLVTGLLSGGVIILFRLFVEKIQTVILPNGDSENYEALAQHWMILLPIISSVLIGLMLWRFSGGIYVFGVARVMERMAYHQGYISVRGFLLQFFGAAMAIIGGHSVGRESPNVYLGAAAGSLFGQGMRLPNNSIRTLVASGSAAGIAASFNTPLAGVIFALEVVMMEYSLASFIPVMLAAVVATAASNAVFGSDPVFVVEGLELISLKELPVLLLLGLVVGGIAALFNHGLSLVAQKSRVISIGWRVVLAGLIVGSFSWMRPEVMAIGYDTVADILLGEIGLTLLLLLLLFKLLATTISIGMGIPAGMISPSLFIGACIGAIVGIGAVQWFGMSQSHIGFYALLGMAAMMGASLQAPLAALTAIVELTYSPGIIMPAMFTIVIAQLVASEVFKKESLFVATLRANGLDYSSNPVLQVLRGIGVTSVMSDKFIRLDQTLSIEEAEKVVLDAYDWILVNDEEGDVISVMPSAELAKFLQTEEVQVNETVNLLRIPAGRLQPSVISMQANLQQAHEKFEQGAEILYVIFSEKRYSAQSRIYGIVTKKMLDNAYKPRTRIAGI